MHAVHGAIVFGYAEKLHVMQLTFVSAGFYYNRRVLRVGRYRPNYIGVNCEAVGVSSFSTNTTFYWLAFVLARTNRSIASVDRSSGGLTGRSLPMLSLTGVLIRWYRSLEDPVRLCLVGLRLIIDCSRTDHSIIKYNKKANGRKANQRTCTIRNSEKYGPGDL